LGARHGLIATKNINILKKITGAICAAALNQRPENGK
jgi:hypothetical protein